jgi:uracil phosphoribosyltransferase
MSDEVKHLYGSHVHILNSATLNSLLAQACLPETKQPRLSDLVAHLYEALLLNVLDKEFPKEAFETPTRMTEHHPEARLKTSRLQVNQKTVSVDLARAGIWPSQVCYQLLTNLLNPEMVRQDHVYAARQTDSKGQVTGTSLAGSKIGGDVEKSIVLFPDPMGATGSTMCEVLNHYKKHAGGKALKYISLHLIITPEFIKKLKAEHPDLIIYSLRLDRGLSAPDVLSEIPGKRWDEERGLDHNQYIVPGAGGVGEVLNNAFV